MFPADYPAPSASSSAVTDERADRRQYPSEFDLATDGFAALTSSGLTTVGGYIAASVGGTDGSAIFPNWNSRNNFRASFRIKVTKSTAGSKSVVGFAVTTQGTLPVAGSYTFTFGYLQGTGLAIVRENVGVPSVILADAALVDGDEYDFSVFCDYSLQKNAGGGTGIIGARITAAATGIDVPGVPPAVNYTFAFYTPLNVLARTNVAAGAITNLRIAAHPLGTVDKPAAIVPIYSTRTTLESAFLHVPAVSNGKLVIACHGHGSSPIESGWTNGNYAATWSALTAAGFTVAIPLMGGDLWGNDYAQARIAELYNALTSYYDLDSEAYLWGNSMGGGAALTAIAKNTIPVRAAYLAEPACDLSALWNNASFTTLPAAYGNDPISRDKNSPVNLPTTAYANVPMLFVASAGDTSIPKSVHTDVMRTKLGTSVPNYLITATGNHNDPSMFRAADTTNFFLANL